MNKKEGRMDGFILIEILVSLLILSGGILFLVRALSMITRSNSQIRNNRMAYLLIDNIYNQLYSSELIIPAKIILNKKEYLWDLTVNDTEDKLSQATVTVTWEQNGSASSGSLTHSTLNIMQ